MARLRAPTTRRYVNPFPNMGNNYQQPESPTVGGGYDYGPSFDDVRLKLLIAFLAVVAAEERCL